MTKLGPEARIRRRREELGMSRRQLADESGLAPSRVWATENAGSDVDPADRERVVDALNRRAERISKLHPIT